MVLLLVPVALVVALLAFSAFAFGRDIGYWRGVREGREAGRSEQADDCRQNAVDSGYAEWRVSTVGVTHVYWLTPAEIAAREAEKQEAAK